MEAARRYYAFDLVPSFWEALVGHARNGRLQSIDRVKAEIDRGKDTLTNWANSDFRQWFISTDQADVVQAYGQIMVWADRQTQFTAAAKARPGGQCRCLGGRVCEGQGFCCSDPGAV